MASRTSTTDRDRRTTSGARDDRRRNERARPRRRPPENRLSESTRRAKWIESPDDRADRKGQTLATTSHEVIEAWADDRGGRPAVATRGPGGEPRVLRIKFDEGSDSLEIVEWDEWFEPFDGRDLVFVYQDRRRDGRQSNFFRLDNPRREDG
jgi:hypothetical protein